MLYQVIILACLAVFLTNLILNLKSLKTPHADSKVPQPAPLISILVPARDEEENIRTCVASLQKQDYPNFEILVLDDNSTDATAEIVNEMAAEDSRIRLIRGEPLPEDWAGKPFACYQLAQEAKGSWLLFIDADTIHEPHMLRSVLALALEEKTSLLSGFPRQLAESLPQKIVIPVFYFIILGWLPLWWLHRARKPKPSMAIGQFFLFPRDEYWRIGGHKTVQGRIVEDMWMGIEISKRGGRHIAVDLSPVVSCNMYKDLKSAWRGLGRVDILDNRHGAGSASRTGTGSLLFLHRAVLLALERLFRHAGTVLMARDSHLPDSRDAVHALAGGQPLPGTCSIPLVPPLRHTVLFSQCAVFRGEVAGGGRRHLERTVLRQGIDDRVIKGAGAPL